MIKKYAEADPKASYANELIDRIKAKEGVQISEVERFVAECLEDLADKNIAMAAGKDKMKYLCSVIRTAQEVLKYDSSEIRQRHRETFTRYGFCG